MANIAICAGRFNPPTGAHYELLGKLIEFSKMNQLQSEIYIVDGKLSSQNKLKNPLSFEERYDIIKKWYPELIINKVSTAYEIIEENPNKIVSWIAGSDRVYGYQKMLDHGNITDVSFIKVDRDSALTKNISATKAREACLVDDYETFKSCMPLSAMTDDEIFELYQKVSHSLGAEWLTTSKIIQSSS